jgi:hypothetical protein
MRRSSFTIERPPDERAPRGCAVAIGWELAAALWRRHLPDALTAPLVCASCRLVMPCPCWRFADAFLADALAPPQPPRAARRVLDEVTRELPRIALPPLPRRRPGAHLEAEMRHTR